LTFVAVKPITSRRLGLSCQLHYYNNYTRRSTTRRYETYEHLRPHSGVSELNLVYYGLVESQNDTDERMCVARTTYTYTTCCSKYT